MSRSLYFRPFLHQLGLVPALTCALTLSTAAQDVERPLTPFEPMTIRSDLGDTQLTKRPERVAVLGMNDLEFLDELQIPVAGMPKDFVPHFLDQYGQDPSVKDIGFIVKPNIEALYKLQPDLVMMTPLQAKNYSEISSFSPVLYYNVNYRNSAENHLETVKAHLKTLGKIFGKEALAAERVEVLEAKVASLRNDIRDRPEKALILLHNNGAFRIFGPHSRYGFVFSDLGVTPASATAETGLHGDPVTSEYIKAANPDILYIVDRTQVMEKRPILSKDQISNPLLTQTKAWQNNRVVFADAEAWYITAAGPTSLSIIIDDIRSGFETP